MAKLCTICILRRVHCYLICTIHLHSSGCSYYSSSCFAPCSYSSPSVSCCSSPSIVYGHNEGALIHLANFDLPSMLSLCLPMSPSPGRLLDLTSPWELAQPMGNQREREEREGGRERGVSLFPGGGLTMHSQCNEFSQFFSLFPLGESSHLG